MSIVLERRLAEISEAQAKKQWWRGLVQQVCLRGQSRFCG